MQIMANPYKQGMSAKRAQGNGASQAARETNGQTSVQRMRSFQRTQSPARTRSVRERNSRNSRSPDMSQVSDNTQPRGGSPSSRRPSTASSSCRLARTSSVSPSRAALPPTMTNPEGRGRKLPATPIR